MESFVLIFLAVIGLYFLYPLIHRFIFENVVIFSALFLTSVIWGFLLVRLFKGSKLDSTFEVGWFHHRYLRFLFILIFVMFAFFVITYPRMQSVAPIGGDTGMYIWKLRLINYYSPIWGIQYIDNSLSFLLFYWLGQTFSVDPLILFTFLPGLLMMFYLLTLYFYAKELFNDVSDKEKAIIPLIALSIAATSTIMLRISIDLHSQMLALALQTISFTCYLKSFRSKRWIPFIISLVVFPLLILVHLATFIVSVIQLLIFLAVSVSLKENRQKTFTLCLLVLFGMFIVSLLFLINYQYPLFAIGNLLSMIFPQTQQTYYLYANHIASVSPFWDPSSYLNKFIMGDIASSFGNVIPSLFALLACPILIKKGGTSRRFLLVQIGLSSFLAMYPLASFGEQWRFTVFIPVSIMAAVVISLLFRSLHRLSFSFSLLRKRSPSVTFKPSVKSMGVIILIVVLLVSVARSIDYQNKLANYPYAVNTDALTEISHVEKLFGKTNSSVVVLVRDSNSWNVFGYVVSPVAIYAGNLAYLLAEKSEPPLMVNNFVDKYIGGVQTLQQAHVFGHLNKYTIVLTEHTYHPDSLERGIMQEVSKGVYIVQNLTLSARLDFFEKWRQSRSLDVTFKDDSSYSTLANTSSLESWNTMNDGGGAASLLSDFGIRGTFKDVRRGYNIVLQYNFKNQIDISQSDFIVFNLLSDFRPLSARFEIGDSLGNVRYWEISSAEAPSFVPSNGLQVNLWNKVILPIRFFTLDYPGAVSLHAISYVRIKMTPDTLVSANVTVDQLNIGKGTYTEPEAIGNFITYNNILPFEYILCFSLATLLAILILFSKLRTYNRAKCR